MRFTSALARKLIVLFAAISLVAALVEPVNLDFKGIIITKILAAMAFGMFLLVVDELFEAAGSVGTDAGIYYMAPGNWRMGIWKAWTIVFLILALLFLLVIWI